MEQRRKQQAVSSPLARLRLSPMLVGGFLVLASAALYYLTLAPTVLWGDDAMFQRALAQGTLTNHPLWGLLARLFARLPLHDLAWRANLASAVYAAGAVGFLFLATLTLSGSLSASTTQAGSVQAADCGPRQAGGDSVRAAIAAGAVLAVSHTFWLEAVRAEVYTLHMLLFLGGLWALLRWRSGRRRRSAWLVLGLAFWVAGTVNHLLLTMAWPGGLWLILSTLAPAARRKALLLLPLAVLVGVLLLWFLQPAFLTEVVLGAARVVVSTFSLSLSRLAMHLVILVYQFPMFGLLTFPGFVHVWRRDRAVAVSLCWMAVLTAAFASTHSILESYVFYLPVFGLIALTVGIGFELVTRSWARVGMFRGWRWLVVGLALLALQVGLYRVTPLLVDRFAPGIIPSRDLPGRRASEFFLWPSKRGYIGARQFVEDTLNLLPSDAMLIADWTIFAPVQYVQEVEGQRQDVWVVQVDPLGMQAIRENNGRRPLFLANADPRYYPLDEFNERFLLQPVGPIIALQLRESGP